MATRIVNITPQVDGIKDTFTTPEEFVQSTVALGYNGQIFPPGVNIDSFPDSQTVKLRFIPTYNSNVDLNSKVLLIYEEKHAVLEDIVGSASPPGF